jgi:hypothetical protein
MNDIANLVKWVDLRRHPVKVIFDLLIQGRWISESRIREALKIHPDNRSMFAYNQVNREVSRLRQAFRRAHIKHIVIARHDMDEPGFVMFEAQR